MNNICISSPANITSEHLADLIENRHLNNAQMAKILGVAGWAIGAWLAGKRQISEKYKEKIYELLKLPASADLQIAPALRSLTNKINGVEVEAGVPHVMAALVETVQTVAYKLADFSLNEISSRELKALEQLLAAYDDNSIARLNQMMASILAERLLIASLTAEEYAKKCIELSENDPFNKELLLEIDSEYLYAHYSLAIDVDQALYERSHLIEEEFGSSHYDERCKYSMGTFDYETGRCLLDDDDRESVLQPIRDQHENKTIDMVIKIFQCTAFEVDETYEPWVESDVYSLTYKISLDHPKFKEHLRMVMNRQFISPSILRPEVREN